MNARERAEIVAELVVFITFFLVIVAALSLWEVR